MKYNTWEINLIENKNVHLQDKNINYHDINIKYVPVQQNVSKFKILSTFF